MALGFRIFSWLVPDGETILSTWTSRGWHSSSLGDGADSSGLHPILAGGRPLDLSAG